MVDATIVAVRVRPLLSWESAEPRWKIIDNKSGKTICQKDNTSNTYQFDHIFDQHSSTEQIYAEICSPIVQSYIDGFNATIFVYGQTSSGKSYTMLGDMDSGTMGIIPSSLFEIFEVFGQKSQRQFLLSVSYMEIYNEKITDLFNTRNDRVKIREDRNGSVTVSSLTEVACKSVEDVIQALAAGNDNRSIGETNFSLRGSRSHTMFTLMLESRGTTVENSPVTVSALNLVDLAGSERPCTNESQRFKEGTYINSSLLALGNVISSLSEGRSHVPYRDSKLTRILQSSLGGNSRTLIICTISPISVDETVSTLRFANRAKKIKNKPIINEVMTIEQALRKEVSSLIEENNILTSKLKESCKGEERNELLTKVHALEDAKIIAERRALALEQRLGQHVVPSQPLLREAHGSGMNVNATDRRRTFFISVASPRLFESRPKDITFVMRQSPLVEAETDDEYDSPTPAKCLNFIDEQDEKESTEQQKQPMRSFTESGIQTHPVVVDSRSLPAKSTKF